jgi:hypothetical protein
VQRLVVSQAPLVSRDTCVSVSATAGCGVQLDPSLPFNVSSSNTVMLLNCTPSLLQSPLDCSSNSLCHVYANATGSPCSPLPLCCTFVADGSSTSYRICVSSEFYSAYSSFVGLDAAEPPAKWGTASAWSWSGQRRGSRSAARRQRTPSSRLLHFRGRRLVDVVQDPRVAGVLQHVQKLRGDATDLPAMWGDRLGLELQWATPREPLCHT